MLPGAAANRLRRVQAKFFMLFSTLARHDYEASRSAWYEYRLRQTGSDLKIVQKKIHIHDDRITGAIDFYNIW